MLARQRTNLLGLLQDRSSDKMPAVRAKSLGSLAACLSSAKLPSDFWDASAVPSKEGDAEIDTSPGVKGRGFSEVVRRRCRDLKSAVRKAAVQVCVCASDDVCVRDFPRARVMTRPR